MKATIFWEDGDNPDVVEILAAHFPSKSLWVKYSHREDFAPVTFSVCPYGPTVFTDPRGNTCRIVAGVPCLCTESTHPTEPRGSAWPDCRACGGTGLTQE